MVIINNIGDYIKSLRKEKKITSRKLAELSQVSQAYISQLETGKHSNPSPEVLERIAKALGIPYLHLMEKAGYTKESDKIELMMSELLNFNKTKQYVDAEFKNVTLELSRSDLDEETRKHLTKVAAKRKSEIQNLDVLIKTLDEQIKKSEVYNKAYEMSKELNRLHSNWDNPDNIKLNELKKVLEKNGYTFKKSTLPKLDLETILTSQQEITINGKILNDEEKQKALQILKITFDK